MVVSTLRFADGVDFRVLSGAKFGELCWARAPAVRLADMNIRIGGIRPVVENTKRFEVCNASSPLKSLTRRWLTEDSCVSVYGANSMKFHSEGVKRGKTTESTM